jgi:hypothetical protein
MACTGGDHDTDAHARTRTHGQTYQRRKDILEALISGIATAEDWRQLLETITTALQSGCVVELEASGEFIIHGNAYNEQELIQEYQDVEMTDAPPLSPSKKANVFASRHLRTRGICPIDGACTPRTLDCLKRRHPVQYMQRTNPRRSRAFHAIKERTKSAFGNGSSRLAHEYTGGELPSRVPSQRILLDSWKVAPVLKTFQDAKIQGLSCERDGITGNPVLMYLEHHGQ